MPHLIKNIHMLRGDTKILTVDITDRQDNIVDLTGAVIKFVVKEHKRDTDAEAVVSLSTITSGITVTNPVQGQFQIKMIPADTVNLIPRRYVYDVQIDLASGDRETPLIGTLELQEDVALA